jgi:hypothetical protein
MPYRTGVPAALSGYDHHAHSRIEDRSSVNVRAAMVVRKATIVVICLTLAALVALLTAKAIHVAASEKEGWAAT